MYFIPSLSQERSSLSVSNAESHSFLSVTVIYKETDQKKNISDLQRQKVFFSVQGGRIEKAWLHDSQLEASSEMESSNIGVSPRAALAKQPDLQSCFLSP